MTREEFIKSDEYIIASVECIVRSHKSVLKTRDELNKFFLGLRDELLLYAQQLNSEPSATIAANSMLGGAKPEPFCTCSQGKGLDTDDEGLLYCIDCGLNVQVQNGT